MQTIDAPLTAKQIKARLKFGNPLTVELPFKLEELINCRSLIYFEALLQVRIVDTNAKYALKEIRYNITGVRVMPKDVDNQVLVSVTAEFVPL